MAYSDLGMSPGQAQAMGGGYQGGDTEGDPGGFAESLGEAPGDGGGLFSTVKGFVDKVFSGTNQNTQKTQRTVPPSQNFNQLKSGYVNNLGFIDALNKDYTISKSGNALYRDTSDMLSARDKAEGLSGRATVASIDPTTGRMFSGVSDPSLSGALSGMMTPQRFQQNIDRTKAYADRSRKMRGQLKGSGVVPRTGNQGVFGFLDLDKDGGIFTSTDPYGTVYGMSNEAIYDPSLPESYRGIPSVYAAKTGGQVKTDPNPTLVEQIGSYVMPGAGLAKLGQYFFPGTTQENTQSKMVNNNNQINKDLVFGQDNLTDQQILSGSDYSDMVPDYLMPPEIIGYRPDGSPVSASDPDAARWRGVGMQ
jgi:hypothetical protein